MSTVRERAKALADKTWTPRTPDDLYDILEEALLEERRLALEEKDGAVSEECANLSQGDVEGEAV